MIGIILRNEASERFVEYVIMDHRPFNTVIIFKEYDRGVPPEAVAYDALEMEFVSPNAVLERTDDEWIADIRVGRKGEGGYVFFIVKEE